MESIRLGRSGLQVSRVGFGGIPIQRLDENDAVRVVRRALDLGVDWIDTAHGYGTSEQRIGKALKGRDRSAVRVFTKGPATDPESIRRQVELSFERLGIDVIDLYQFHFVKSAEAWQQMLSNGTVDVVLRMKSDGRIRHIGASAHSPGAAHAVVTHPAIDVLQYPFNVIMAGDAKTRAVLDDCVSRDVGFIAMKPFGGGVLTDADLCIPFLLQYPRIVLDPGFERTEQVEQVVSIAEKPATLTDRQNELIRELRDELGTRFCRRCGYCEPCPEGVNISFAMNLPSFFKRFPEERLMAGSFADRAATYSGCTDCGQCEEKCPYELPIREMMREAMDHYERRRRVYANG